MGASVSGTVQDESGAPIPGALVVVENAETGAERSLASDAAGRYSTPSVPVGRYEIAASKENFKSQTRTGLDLVVGEHATVDFTLQVGDVKQTVTVAEEVSPVELTNEPTSGLVSERQVKDLPLNGRSFDELITLNPSVVNYTSGRSGGVGTSDSSLGNMFAVAGRRPQENLFLLNGIEFTGASLINITPGGASGQLLGVDAVREFNVVTDTYGAEYGKRPGGQVSIVTASGTNQMHGSVYEFLRNSALDARNFFDQGSIPQFQRNVFGGALGGPLKKNKLFLFGNYEGYRQHLGLSDVTLVPDNAARASAVPAVAPLLSLWPVPNGPELGSGIAEAFSHPLQTVREDFGTARLDYNISNNDTLFGVYTIDDSADNTPSTNPLSLAIEQLREQVLSAGRAARFFADHPQHGPRGVFPREFFLYRRNAGGCAGLGCRRADRRGCGGRRNGVKRSFADWHRRAPTPAAIWPPCGIFSPMTTIWSSRIGRIKLRSADGCSRSRPTTIWRRINMGRPAFRV